jgi:hypothetical protein
MQFDPLVRPPSAADFGATSQGLADALGNLGEGIHNAIVSHQQPPQPQWRCRQRSNELVCHH